MLGDAISDALPSLRAQAESMMRTTVDIDTPGPVVTNPETGAATVATGTPVYTGPARIKPATVAHGSIADSDVALAHDQLSIPVTAPPLRVGMRVVVTASDHEPRLVGGVYRVVAEHVGELTTAQRVGVERWT